jgi:GNAT superfamily N-acetyltransferase
MSVAGRDLDLLGARAWPPLEETRIGEWRLRFAGGVTKRANSVLPLGPDQDGAVAAALEARIRFVEDAYRERGLSPRFQLTASSWPAALGTALRTFGYVEADRTLVMTAALTSTGAHTQPVSCTIIEQAEPSATWLDTWWAVDGRGGDTEREIAQAILDRIQLPRIFVEYHDRNGPAAVALAVLDGDWVGFYCLATLPRARRRGYARALIAHLITRAKAQGARRAHLAVVEANQPSRRLCGALGFVVSQQYSYLTGTDESR